MENSNNISVDLQMYITPDKFEDIGGMEAAEKSVIRLINNFYKNYGHLPYIGHKFLVGEDGDILLKLLDYCSLQDDSKLLVNFIESKD